MLPSIRDCRLVPVRSITDARGSLAFAEDGCLPFKVRRVFWLYGIQPGAVRGGHAHRWHDEILIAMSGSFTVRVQDRQGTAEFVLDRPDCGLFLPHHVWQVMYGFTPGAVYMVLADDVYSEKDYYRDYIEWKKAVTQ